MQSSAPTKISTILATFIIHFERLDSIRDCNILRIMLHVNEKAIISSNYFRKYRLDRNISIGHGKLYNILCWIGIPVHIANRHVI